MSTFVILKSIIQIGTAGVIFGGVSKVAGQKEISNMIRISGLLGIGVNTLLLIEPLITWLTNVGEKIALVGDKVVMVGDKIGGILSYFGL